MFSGFNDRNQVDTLEELVASGDFSWGIVNYGAADYQLFSTSEVIHLLVASTLVCPYKRWCCTSKSLNALNFAPIQSPAWPGPPRVVLPTYHGRLHLELGQSQAVPQIYQQDIVARNFVDGYGKKQIYQVVFSVLINKIVLSRPKVTSTPHPTLPGPFSLVHL